MKQSIPKMALILFSTTLMTHVTVAQKNSQPAGNDVVLANAMIAMPTSESVNYAAPAAAVTSAGNSKIDAKFAGLFPAAQEQQWLADAKGYWVSFNDDGRKTRAGFTSNGKLNYIIKDASWNHLSADLQQFINKNYVGYDLMNAIEITAFGERSQQVILQNATAYISLNSGADGIEEIKKVSKAD